MSIAKGQDELATSFLQNTPNSIDIVIPSICYVESLMTLEQEDKYKQDFIQRLYIQIHEAGRDKNSQNAKLLVNHLQQANLSFSEHSNEIEKRFYSALINLITKAEEIPLTTEIIHRSLSTNILEKHFMDKLILECILYHARLYSDEIKVFLSANSKEFGKREVTAILRDHGIQYFPTTHNFLGWFNSQFI